MTSFERNAGRDPERVLEVLSSCRSFDGVRAAGILFHGTSETIEGDLRGGGYDGVFWMAETPSVAQAYIPESGVRVFWPRPRADQMRDPVWPDRNDLYAWPWALESSGLTEEEMRIEWDGVRARGFSRPAGSWPTLEDHDRRLRDLGYDTSAASVTLVTRARGNAREIMPAGWKMSGSLIIALPDWDVTEDTCWGESDNQDPNHNRLGDFETMRQDGVAAFRMSDTLQSRGLGNVGHEAIGVLPRGLERMSWMSVPAIRNDGDEMSAFMNEETDDFLALMREISPQYGDTSPQP